MVVESEDWEDGEVGMNAVHPSVWLPTSVLFLDDEATFLTSMPRMITDAYPCLLNTSPGQSLKILEQAPTTPLGLDRSTLDLDAWFGSCARFETVSVVVVDFEMPNMRGLEFCRRIRHLPAKRILLTGTMDKGAAVEAFNEGLIHRYLRKDAADSMPELHRYIGELQREYLKEMTERPAFGLVPESPAWLQDKALMEVVSRLILEQNFVEYVSVRGGLVVADSAGSVSLLLVRSGEEMVRQEARLSEVAALSAELKEKLARRELVYFDPGSNDLLPVGTNEDSLLSSLHPARSVLGTADNYSVCLLEDFSPVMGETCGMDDFVDELEHCLW